MCVCTACIYVYVHVRFCSFILLIVVLLLFLFFYHSFSFCNSCLKHTVSTASVKGKDKSCWYVYCFFFLLFFIVLLFLLIVSSIYGSLGFGQNLHQCMVKIVCKGCQIFCRSRHFIPLSLSSHTMAFYLDYLDLIGKQQYVFLISKPINNIKKSPDPVLFDSCNVRRLEQHSYHIRNVSVLSITLT